MTARTPTWPRVSVLVPTYQAARSLPGCLDAVWAQAYPGEVEVVVSDGGSTDGTLDLVAREIAAGRALRLIHNPARIQAAGLNLAAEAASGEILVRCDAHATLPSNALERFVAEHRRVPRANVGGRQVGQPTGTVVGDAVAALYNTALGSGGAAYRRATEPADADTVYLGSWPRGLLAELGGFHPAFAVNEDAELNARLRAAGGRVRLLPDVAVGYRPRGSLGDLARQYARYGLWRTRTARLHGGVGARQAAALAPLACLVAGLAAPWQPLAAAPLGAYLAVAVAGGLAAPARPAARLAAPVALATMHLAWGCGFAAGVASLPWSRLRPHHGPVFEAAG